MYMRVVLAWTAVLSVAMAAAVQDLQRARDIQDRAALDKMAAEAREAAEKQSNDAASQYRFALAQSYAAEVAVEKGDKAKARELADSGIQAAQKAANLRPDNAEYHRLLGTLCGQMISSAGLAGIRYGNCALSEVNKAIELDPKAAINYLSHGVGNYYLPQALGGGMEQAIKDFQKAISLDPKSADAYLWLGIALRREKRNADARQALAKAVELNPNRLWAKQQLDKTPAQ